MNKVTKEYFSQENNYEKVKADFNQLVNISIEEFIEIMKFNYKGTEDALDNPICQMLGITKEKVKKLRNKNKNKKKTGIFFYHPTIFLDKRIIVDEK